MSGAGHAPFRDDAETFNRRLESFCEDVARERDALAGELSDAHARRAGAIVTPASPPAAGPA